MTNIRMTLMALTLAALCCLPPGETSGKTKKKPAREEVDPDARSALIQGMEVPKLTAQTPVGRFQMHPSGARSCMLLLCDTATGQVWWIQADGNGLPNGVDVWRPCVKPLVKD